MSRPRLSLILALLALIFTSTLTFPPNPQAQLPPSLSSTPLTWPTDYNFRLANFPGDYAQAPPELTARSPNLINNLTGSGFTLLKGQNGLVPVDFLGREFQAEGFPAFILLTVERGNITYDFDLSLLDPTGVAIFNSTNAAGQDEWIGPFAPETTGTYTIRVTANSEPSDRLNATGGSGNLFATQLLPPGHYRIQFEGKVDNPPSQVFWWAIRVGGWVKEVRVNVSGSLDMYQLNIYAPSNITAVNRLGGGGLTYISNGLGSLVASDDAQGFGVNMSITATDSTVGFSDLPFPVVEVVAEYGAGEADIFIVPLDNAPPTLSLSQINQTISEPPVNVNITATDNFGLANVTYSLNGFQSATIPLPGNTTFSTQISLITLLPDALNELVVTASDLSGNKVQATRSFTYTPYRLPTVAEIGVLGTLEGFSGTLTFTASVVEGTNPLKNTTLDTSRDGLVFTPTTMNRSAGNLYTVQIEAPLIFGPVYYRVTVEDTLNRTATYPTTPPFYTHLFINWIVLSTLVFLAVIAVAIWRLKGRAQAPSTPKPAEGEAPQTEAPSEPPPP